MLKKFSTYLSRQAFRRRLHQKSQLLEFTPKPTIIFSPHQDDETLGCGGLIAMRQQQGIPVWVVFTTDGRACYPEGTSISPEECIETRKQEALKALKILGVDASRICFLKYPDSSLESLDSEPRQALVQELQEILLRVQPQEVYVPYSNDVHPDHIATCGLVKEALRSSDLKADLLEYMVWSLWQPDYLKGLTVDQLAHLYSLSIHSVRHQKRQALRVYRSQYLPISTQFKVLPRGFLDFFCAPYELFIRHSAG